jgi:hypothetical protein
VKKTPDLSQHLEPVLKLVRQLLNTQQAMSLSSNYGENFGELQLRLQDSALRGPHLARSLFAAFNLPVDPPTEKDKDRHADVLALERECELVADAMQFMMMQWLKSSPLPAEPQWPFEFSTTEVRTLRKFGRGFLTAHLGI